jgi:hypothetical protein
MVPIHWLPLQGLTFSRAIAVVLDHPFVRLQRQLAGAFSTVTHITRDDIGNLLIPAVSNEVWDQWEKDVSQAQSLVVEADAIAKAAIAIAEDWYA